MGLSIERLRWLLVLGGALLVVMLAALIGYGRYHALKIFREAANRILHSPHETRNFTYSATLLGRTSYTLHADRVVQHGDGTYSLFDVAVVLHSKTSTEVDRVYAHDIEYDEKTQVGRAIGEVRMELEVPQGVATSRHGAQAPPTSASGNKQVVFVETSDAVYLRKLGVAATQSDVHFRWGQLMCTSHGAEFQPGESTLHLLADVHATGAIAGRPLDLTAASAFVDRVANIADLDHPTAHTGGRSGSADYGQIHLRKDGSVDHGTAKGNVVLAEGTAQVHAAMLDADVTPNNLLQTAHLGGGVTMVDSNAARPAQGSAGAVDLRFGDHGEAREVVARGQAALTFTQALASGRPIHRSMHGDTITAELVPVTVHGKVSSQLSSLHAVGAAEAQGEAVSTPKGAVAPQVRFDVVRADDLLASFVPGDKGGALVQALHGTGRTVLQQDSADGAHAETHGDVLEMTFAKNENGAAQLEQATQTGHLTMLSRSAAKPGAKTVATTSTGSAAAGVYDAATDTLRLTGGTSFSDGENSLTAAEVTVHQGSGDAEARGNVLASIDNQSAGRDGPKTSAQSAEQPVTHVMSAEAKFVRDGKLAEFRGTDAAPARLWQGASQVRAADLLFDDVRRSLTARPALAGGLVQAVFVSQGGGLGSGSRKDASEARPNTRSSSGAKAGTDAGMSVVHVASPRMVYSDLGRKAVFEGGVHIENGSASMEGQRAMLTLTPAQKPSREATATGDPNPLNRSIETMVLYGDVRLKQPGRVGTGDQLTYTAAEDRYTLTGTAPHLPHIVDAQQGNVTGTTLVFTDAGSTIIVAGRPGQPNGRVRTELEVRH